MASTRILLVHLVSKGDCLMATTVARQIKTDFPDCHLTWAIGYECAEVIENNPFVDDIWSVAYSGNELPYDDVWYETKKQAEDRKRNGEFDRVYYTQLVPDNVNNFDGTTRTSIFRSYPGKISVPVQPVVRLFAHEVANVQQFAVRHALQAYRNVVLFECSPQSGQSCLTPEIAIRLANAVIEERDDTVFLISSHRPLGSVNQAVIDASVLSYRENAELSKYCTLLLGGSSGLTWLTTSTAAKRIPTIQFLNRRPPWYSFASVKYDHEYLGLDASHILESDLRREYDMAQLVKRYLVQGSFDGLPRTEFVPSVDQIYGLYRLMRGRIDVTRVLNNFIDRNRGVEVNRTAFYSGLAQLRLRVGAKELLRRAATSVARSIRAGQR